MCDLDSFRNILKEAGVVYNMERDEIEERLKDPHQVMLTLSDMKWLSTMVFLDSIEDNRLCQHCSSRKVETSPSASRT